MGVKPTKPRYTCQNCKWGDKPREVPCTICKVMDSPTVMPRKWEPVIDLAKWSPTATKEGRKDD